MRAVPFLLLLASPLACATGNDNHPTTTSTGTGGATATTTSSVGAAGGAGGSGAASSGTGGTATGGGGASSVASTASAGGAGQGGAGVGGQGGQGGAAPITFFQFCNGVSTTVTGTVYAPNGKDPLPGIAVYAAKKVNPYPASFCDKCSDPVDERWAATTSAVDGTYTLNLDNAAYGPFVTFVVQIGRFRKVSMLPVAECASVPLLKQYSTLPGNSVDGEIPKIVVSTGNKDHLDDILDALGITEYDCYEGTKNGGSSTCTLFPNAKIPDVLTGKAPAKPLSSYDMLFLSCAPGAYAQWTASGYSAATMNTAIANFVSGGGRLIATDTAYDYIEQAIPDAIEFAGPKTAMGVPQPVGGANVGCSSGVATQYPAVVDDPTLAAWLPVVGVATSPNVSIAGFIQPWAVIDTLPPGTTRIAGGTMGANPAACMTADHPLTAEFDVNQCGRAIYSSYHTLSAVNANGLSAQEKILEFLMFSVASCHN